MQTRAPILCRLAWLGAVALVAACQDDAPSGEAVSVPSGRALSLIDIVTDTRGPSGATARFRFLAPGLTEAEVDSSDEDMQAVCDTFAIKRIDGMVPAPRQIIISFSSAAVPFGQTAPDVVQFFESYRPENGACIWEVF